MGFFEVVAHCVAPLLMDMKYFGRRGALSLMFFIGGISCLGSLLFKNLSRCATDEVTLCDEVSQVNSHFRIWSSDWWFFSLSQKIQYLVCNTILLQISRWLAFIGKFGVAACFAIIYTFSVELYPTCARGSALGMCSAGARIGGIACPLILGFDQKISWLSNFIFGVASIIASLVALRFKMIPLKSMYLS